jgi:hypothetical protein
MTSVERWLVAVETRPWDVLYRALIGLATLWIVSRLKMSGVADSDWLLVPVLLAVFLALRVVPVVARKLVPFSKSAQEVWVQRRTMAKRYDSYQWQKLLGFGIGLALYTAVSGQHSTARIAVAAFCLSSGAVGTILWQNASGQVNAAQRATKLATPSSDR